MNINFTSVTKLYDSTTNKHCGYIIIKNDIPSSVPLDTANSDYQAIQEWIKEGGTVIDNPPQENN
jgi:hypothetical protein